MNIFVCIKQVPSTSKVQVDEKDRGAEAGRCGGEDEPVRPVCAGDGACGCRKSTAAA